MAKYIFPTLLTALSMSLLTGCVTQSFENNEPIVKNQANLDEMAATRVSLGLGYLKMGDMSQAKLNLEKAKRFSPELVQVHTAFAHYYETVGESDLAITSFEEALTIKADSADTLNNYGVFLCRQGKVAAAEVQFLKAIAVPSYLLVAQSYENLASCYLQNDNFEKAEMYLNKAISHNPNRTATLLQMVRLQYAMTDYKEAKRFLQRFERNTQRFTSDSLALAYKVNWKLGKRRTASNYGNMLVKMYPQSWEGKQYLLNELEFIEADNLANKYKLSQKEKNRHLTPTSNKRVVKLSPKKSGNSPYTNSNKTTTVASKPESKQTGTQVYKQTTTPAQNLASNSMTTNKTNAVVKQETSTAATVSSQSLVAGTTKSALGSGTALLSATVAGTVAASNIPVNTGVAVGSSVSPTAVQATQVSQTSQIAQTNKAAQVTNVTQASAAPLNSKSVVAAQTVSSTIEPTSTQPVPATRDVPLPEALPEEVIEEKIAAEVVAVETAQVSNDEVLHTVTPGENLYNISVKYNVKLSALRKWNNISEKNKIRIGDKLYVADPQTVNNINE